MECFGKYRGTFLYKHIPISVNRKVFNQCVLSTMMYKCKIWILSRAVVKKLETSQQAFERNLLHVKLKDRIKTTITGQKSKVKDS